MAEEEGEALDEADLDADESQAQRDEVSQQRQVPDAGPQLPPPEKRYAE